MRPGNGYRGLWSDRDFCGANVLMPRRFASIVGSFGVGLWLIFGLANACSSSPVDARFLDAGGTPRLDGAPVTPPGEAGDSLDAGSGLPTSCDRYCNFVTTNCTLDNAQYASNAECLAFCAFLPLEQLTHDVEEKHAGSVACRQYWADSPARTDPSSYCLAAGPFGGNVCGDRCMAFCDALLSACAPTRNGATPAYASQPDCATACASFSYRDASADGGGEAPGGPDAGDTLNCRLFHLRRATLDPQACALLHPDSGACRD